MEKTKENKGAVCFIDLLGFSYLTDLIGKKNICFSDDNNDSNIKKELIKSIVSTKEHSSETVDETLIKEQSIGECAFDIIDTNLKRFHRIIKEKCPIYDEIPVKYTALSDSVFLVCDDTDKILFVLANIFRDCIKSGILLRAGLSYGTYYTVETQIEKFNVFGPAVTQAVGYEKTGKGCRVFTKCDFPCKLVKENPKLFNRYTNYVDYKTFDVFEWLMIHDDYLITKTDFIALVCNPRKQVKNIKKIDRANAITSYFDKTPTEKKALQLIIDNDDVLSYLAYSPDFSWNLLGESGNNQMDASIEYITTAIENIYKIDSKTFSTMRLSKLIKIKSYKLEKIERNKNGLKKSMEIKKNVLFDFWESPIKNCNNLIDNHTPCDARRMVVYHLWNT